MESDFLYGQLLDFFAPLPYIPGRISSLVLSKYHHFTGIAFVPVPRAYIGFSPPVELVFSICSETFLPVGTLKIVTGYVSVGVEFMQMWSVIHRRSPAFAVQSHFTLKITALMALDKRFLDTLWKLRPEVGRFLR